MLLQDRERFSIRSTLAVCRHADTTENRESGSSAEYEGPARYPWWTRTNTSSFSLNVVALGSMLSYCEAWPDVFGRIGLPARHEECIFPGNYLSPVKNPSDSVWCSYPLNNEGGQLENGCGYQWPFVFLGE